MSPFETLLAVQARDTTIDQLHHRRDTLPERAELTATQSAIASIDLERAELQARLDEIGGRETDAERSIRDSEARIAAIDKRMYSGEVSASRDLQAMATEIDSLKARISALEDVALAALDEREPFDEALAALDARRGDLVAKAADLAAAIADAEVALDTEIASETQARATIAGDVPTELLATYERLRARLGGIGAARLEGGRCTGCHLSLPATEVDRIKHEPPDALLFCDQCGRILVR
ncbi:MAG TPA: C4-type zinc ribbon domain-containing protein [Acidimicrobiales bacterium]|nr:C4-type zinc ribbon domain-containing protein [Acidimicrobiales bacterium]